MPKSLRAKYTRTLSRAAEEVPAALQTAAQLLQLFSQQLRSEANIALRIVESRLSEMRDCAREIERYAKRARDAQYWNQSVHGRRKADADSGARSGSNKKRLADPGLSPPPPPPMGNKQQRASSGDVSEKGAKG